MSYIKNPNFFVILICHDKWRAGGMVHTSDHDAQCRRLLMAGAVCSGRPCLDISQQMQAVDSTIRVAKKAFIHDHIDHCLDKATGGGRITRNPIAEFKSITKYC